jgi:hypothetical protein
MIRFLLVLVAVLIAVLALVLDRPWLYAAAGVPLLGALGLLGQQLWEAYQRREGAPTAPSDTPPLEDLGIMDVRPHDRQGGSNGSSASGAEPSVAPAGTQSDPAPEGADGAASVSATDPESETATQTVAEAAPDVDADEQPVLGPFLESLRAALGARTVGLLVQEEVILEYRIEACASTEPGPQNGSVFETQSPLLTATMSRQSVTVRRMNAEDRADLGYYETAPAIEQVALAPVPESNSASTVFLLADATAEVDLEASGARSLLERFADTIEMLRDADPAASDSEEEAFVEAESPNGAPAETDGEADPPRPRHEIIAEEMTAADAGDDDLALVLVHLNRAESIARRGPEAVDTAEQLLRTRLEHFAPGQRVERFGELTYGLFPRQGLDEVETWAADLQDALAEETGELEGGVSVGVAVRSPRHDAQELRADATEALREAYETGTCTIVA